jgi:glycosyltransferase involved in cell wall biosynthesis
MKISAVVLTKNEEKNIDRCLKSISFCDEIIIVDDYSIDKTIEKVNEFKGLKSLKVFQRKLNNDFAGQRNFGLSKATNDWVLFIDADEEVSEDLRKEIVSLLAPRSPAQRDGVGFHGSIVKENAFYVRRKDYFWGRELRYGEIRRIRQIGIIRLVRKNSGRWLGDVHEVFHTAENCAGLKGFLNHYPHQTLKDFIEDINYYSSIRAEELYSRGEKTNVFQIVLYPFGKFIYNYFISLGFLDGPAGFVYAFMMSFHSFLVRAKLSQMINSKIVVRK